MTPSHTIFIRTYAKDADWLRYCLFSCQNKAPNTPIIVICPHGSHDVIHPLTVEFGCGYDTLAPAHEDGYLDQQFTKLHADQWVHTEYVIHLDSDCVLLRSVADLFADDGRPLLLKTPWHLLESKGEFVWKQATTNILGLQPQFEFMRRQPLVYPRSVYAGLRNFLEARHGRLLDWFSKFPTRDFSEFNLLGAWCHEYAHDRFHWVNTAEEPLPPLVARQGWSWGGLLAVRKEWGELVPSYEEPSKQTAIGPAAS